MREEKGTTVLFVFFLFFFKNTKYSIEKKRKKKKQFSQLADLETKGRASFCCLLTHPSYNHLF